MHVELKIEDLDKVVVIKILTTRIKYDDSDDFGQQLKEIGAAHFGRNILLNMENVEYLTSDALGRLTGFQRAVEESGGVFKLVIWSKTVRDIFKTTNLDRILDIHNDADKALNSF